MTVLPEPHTPAKRTERKRRISVALAVSVLVHAVILLELGHIILTHGTEIRQPFTGTILDVTPPEPVLSPDEQPVSDLPPSDTPPSAPEPGSPPPVISSDVVPGLAPPAGPNLHTGLPAPKLGPLQDGGPPRQPAPPRLGDTKKIPGGLTGYLYDLKQTRTGDKTNARYRETLASFAQGDWNEKILRDFFKSKKPLYLTQVFIPSMPADEAPRAFQSPDVEPRNIVILYTGKTTFPATGEFRLVGLGDDYLLVRLNDKVVLDGSLRPLFPDLQSGENLGTAYTTPIRTTLKAGPWFHAEKGQTVPVEILLGEEPGGHFAAFLLFQQQGVTYRMRSDTPEIPALPVLQFVPTGIPASDPGTSAPDISEPEIFFGAEKD
jgi:hypothetical protein